MNVAEPKPVLHNRTTCRSPIVMRCMCGVEVEYVPGVLEVRLEERRLVYRCAACGAAPPRVRVLCAESWRIFDAQGKKLPERQEAAS